MWLRTLPAIVANIDLVALLQDKGCITTHEGVACYLHALSISQRVYSVKYKLCSTPETGPR